MNDQDTILKVLTDVRVILYRHAERLKKLEEEKAKRCPYCGGPT